MLMRILTCGALLIAAAAQAKQADVDAELRDLMAALGSS